MFLALVRFNTQIFVELFLVVVHLLLVLESYRIVGLLHGSAALLKVIEIFHDDLQVLITLLHHLHLELADLDLEVHLLLLESRNRCHKNNISLSLEQLLHVDKPHHVFDESCLLKKSVLLSFQLTIVVSV